MQFLVGFNVSNLLASITLEKQGTFFKIPREIQNAYFFKLSSNLKIPFSFFLEK